MKWEKITYGSWLDNQKRIAEGEFDHLNRTEERRPTKESFVLAIGKIWEAEMAGFDFEGTLLQIFAGGSCAWIQVDHHKVEGEGPFIDNVAVKSDLIDTVLGLSPYQRCRGRIEKGLLLSIEPI